MRTVRFDSDSIFNYYFQQNVERAVLNDNTYAISHGRYFRMLINYDKKEYDYAIGRLNMTTDSTSAKMIFPKFINKELVRQHPELFK